ncbi:hypothetical protein D6D27_02938 [Aureobasidium pullulans]|nr:hypothetical protein D6D27_02938 [Aureobasidium pullulans]
MDTETQQQVYLRALNDQEQAERSTLNPQRQESHEVLHAQTKNFGDFVMQAKRDRIEARIKEDQGIFEARLQGYKEVTEAQDLKLCSQLGEIRNLKERLRYSVNTMLLTQNSEDLHDGETQRGAVKRGSDNPTEEEVR